MYQKFGTIQDTSIEIHSNHLTTEFRQFFVIKNLLGNLLLEISHEQHFFTTCGPPQYYPAPSLFFVLRPSSLFILTPNLVFFLIRAVKLLLLPIKPSYSHLPQLKWPVAVPFCKENSPSGFKVPMVKIFFFYQFLFVVA